MKKSLFTFLIYISIAQPGESNTGLQFLTFSQLPRGSGLGEAFTAVSGDLTSAGFNPAGMAGVKNIQFAFMHKAWLQDIYLNYGAVALPKGNDVFSLNLVFNTTPGIEIRDQATLQPIGTTDANDLAVSLGWSRSLQGFDAGIAAKFLYEKIYLESAGGWAIDLGAQKSYRQFRFGAAMRNWGPDLKFDQEKFSPPTELRLGAGYSSPKEFLQGEWLVLADLVKAKGFDPYLNLGLEYGYQKQFYGRLGYKGAEKNQSNFALGIGVKVRKYTIDYAFVPFKEDLGNSHQIAVILSL